MEPLAAPSHRPRDPLELVGHRPARVHAARLQRVLQKSIPITAIWMDSLLSSGCPSSVARWEGGAGHSISP
jgi:hypothetical protein